MLEQEDNGKSGTTILTYGDTSMKLDANNLQTIGSFLDTKQVEVSDRVILYVIDNVHYRIDDGGCWYFAEEPEEMGWTPCDPPALLQSMG
ncbi:MAG: hypothetical protein GY703_08860 [Gammaproteobacteria bacterium]|nr:hypothetical protein [Gammaproteobacteria bacterium]